MTHLRFGRLPRALTASLFALVLAGPFPLCADPVDDTVTALMAKRKIRGLSLAVIEDGAIVKARGYGVIDAAGSAPVTPETLFQAGSISKPVAAFGALVLVQQGKLALDTNVNDALTTWRVPDNAFTAAQKVTLRRLLSHSAGLTVHGFPGYAVGTPVPTLVQVLDGAKPANTAPIRVDLEPGSKWRYSGGGYTVLQQLMIDASGREFPALMQTLVLAPLGLTRSSYQQPLPADWAARTATGHRPTGPSEVAGRWHVYPEMAAAGLWTTPSDLARFAIAVQDAFAGRGESLLSRELARDMLTRQKADFGLGVGLAGQGRGQRFQHGGRDEGFDAMMTAYVEARQGAVVMINANDNTGTISRVLEAIAEAYRWPDFPRRMPTKPIEDKEPEVTAVLRRAFEQAKAGVLDRELYTPQLADAIAASLASEHGGRAELNAFGALKEIALVGREDQDGQRRYRYRFTYENETILVRCAYNAEGKIAGLAFQPE